jgi:hypothetical protein
MGAGFGRRWDIEGEGIGAGFFGLEEQEIPPRQRIAATRMAAGLCRLEAVRAGGIWVSLEGIVLLSNKTPKT